MPLEATDTATAATAPEKDMQSKWDELSTHVRTDKGYEVDFVKRMGPAFETALKKKYPDMPEDTRLMRAQAMLAQSAIESRWGASALSNSEGIVDEKTGQRVVAHNYGGIKKGSSWGGETALVGSWERDHTSFEHSEFRVYKSDQDYADNAIEVMGHATYHQPGKNIDEAKNIFDYAYKAGKSGYCDDDPGGYASQIASVAGRMFPGTAATNGVAAQAYYTRTDEDGTPEEKKRKAGDFMNSQLNNPDLGGGDKLAMLIFALIFGIMSGEGPEKILQAMLGGNSFGNGMFSSPEDRGGVQGAGIHKYTGTYEMGGASQNPEYAGMQLPAYKGGDAGKHFAECALSTVGRSDAKYINWVSEKGGYDHTGAYWCALDASKTYEGSGLFKYTASALDFADQGAATGSYRQGVGNLNGIKAGDPVVFTRGGGGHVGICTGVNTDAGGNVVSVETVEGNSIGGKVALRTHTREQLMNGEGDHHYQGYVDIKDRAQKMGINLEQELAAHYQINQTIQVAKDSKQDKAEQKKTGKADDTKSITPDLAAALISEHKDRVAKGTSDGYPPKAVADIRPAAEPGRVAVPAV